MAAPEITLYRFHPETGEDARLILEPDFTVPGATPKEIAKGREYINEAKRAGWLPYWQGEPNPRTGVMEYHRTFDENIAYVARMMGRKITKVEVPASIAR